MLYEINFPVLIRKNTNEDYVLGTTWADIFDQLSIPKKLYKKGKIVVEQCGGVGIVKELVCGLPDDVFLWKEKKVDEEDKVFYKNACTVFIKQANAHHYQYLICYIGKI